MTYLRITIDPDDVDLFWSNVIKTDGCWTFGPPAAMPAQKYRNFRGVRAHRYSYTLTYGPIPDGLVVMHLCDNPPCVRPDHLKAGTHLENLRDAHAKGLYSWNRHAAKQAI